jgi:hypothetical protein
MIKYNVTYKTSQGNSAVTVIAKSAHIAIVYVEVQYHAVVIGITLAKG